MALSAKQKTQVARAPQKQRAALKQLYERQNKQNPSTRAVPSRKDLLRSMAPRIQPAPAPRPRKTKVPNDGYPELGQGICMNFMDPKCPMPVPTTVSAGKALPHTALASKSFSVPPNHTGLVIAMQVAGSSSVGFHCLLDHNKVMVSLSDAMYDVPTLSAASLGGGCTASRAMRLSCSVVNTTNVVNRGGAVTYINSAQRLPPIDPEKDFSQFVEGIVESPYRKVTTGDTLLGTPSCPNKLVSYPTDMTLYNSFESHAGALGYNSYMRRIAQHVVAGGNVLNALPRSMSVIAWIFDPPPLENTYRVTIRASYYTRWPLETVPGYHMKAIPTIDAKTYNGVVDHVEEHANTLTAAAEGGMIAVAGPKVAQGAAYLGRAALTAMRGAVTEAVELAPFALA